MRSESGNIAGSSWTGITDMSLSAILGEVPDPIAVVSRDYEMLWANGIVLRFCKARLEDLHGRRCHEIIFKRNNRCFDCPVGVVFDSGRPSSVEKCISCEDGSIVWKEVRVYPIRQGNGTVIGAIRIGFDITEKKVLDDRQTRDVELLERTLSQMTGASPDESGYDWKKGCYGELTKRELQVLRLLPQGLSNMEISRILQISPHTVKSHVVHIFNKLGVSHRTEAVAKALYLKLI